MIKSDASLRMTNVTAPAASNAQIANAQIATAQIALGLLGLGLLSSP